MNLPPFKLERYFARYEFATNHLLASSDCDGLALAEVLSWADPEARGLWDGLTLGYTESAGLPLLRAEVAGLYEDAAPDDVLIAAPEECIWLAANALLRPGDHVICTFPGYQSLYEIAAGLGCEVTRWLPDEAQSWRFDPEFLAANLRPNTRLIIWNFPHNPTGALPSQADFARMLQIASGHGAHVFSDEMYRWLEPDPARQLPSACEAYERAVSLCGMSKTFGLAGLRLGWVVTHDAGAYERMVAAKDYTTICSAAPSEVLALIGLRSRERIIARHRARIAANQALAGDFFAAHSRRFRWVPPAGGTIAFPALIDNTSAADFCRRAVEDAGVMLLPSTVYDYDDRHFRLGLGRGAFPAGLEQLARFVDAGGGAPAR